MKKLLNHTFVAALLLLAARPLQAQDITATLNSFADNYQPERVHLHFDKAAYSPGETVWFKAYLMQEIFPAASGKSLYIDWIGDNGDVLSHSVSPIVDGITNGQFAIPENYNGTALHLKAYTRWMLNFDSAFLYSKDIRVLSAKGIRAPASPVAPVIAVQFFPEGGDAVAGVSNVIAFKAANQWGDPVKISGTILDDKGAAVTAFSTLHDGMGVFSFTPKPGVVYDVQWKDDKGKSGNTRLYSIKPSGIAVHVSASGAYRTISISGSADMADNLKELHVVGTMHGRPLFNTPATLAGGGTAQRRVPIQSLPSGILTITVFDKSWNAVAERITFINNNNFTFQPQLEVQHWGLNRRAKNEMQLTVPDSLMASFSVSVTDAGIEKDSSNTIISQLLLTSDIKGKVTNPAYYFSNSSDSVAKHLDLVMMTNGWRRFKWEELTKNKLPTLTYPVDSAYLSLSGKVFGAAKSMLTGKESMAVIVKKRDSSSQMLIMPIDKDGTFGDPSIILFDTVNIYYSLKSKMFSTAEARFMTERLPAPNYTAESRNFVLRAPFISDTTGLARHNQLVNIALKQLGEARGKVMETVTIKTVSKSPIQQIDEKYTSGLFRGADAYQFDFINDPTAMGSMNVFNYLQGRVAGLQISGMAPNVNMQWRGATPTLFLDEMQTDVDMISNIPVADIAYVKVFRPPFFGASGGGSGGAIAIYTRRGGDVASRPGSGLAKNAVIAYSPIREFYAPNYDRSAGGEESDVRTTLYWNPLLVNGKSGKATFSFYNNDVTKAFRVVIEGMTRDGLLTHIEQIIE